MKHCVTEKSMNQNTNNAGIFVTVLLVLLSLESLVTQEEGTFPGHQVLFWGSFFIGCAMFAWFAKHRPQKDLFKVVAVVVRRRIRRIL